MIERLEMGASVTEVAQAFEVNPNMLQQWRREPGSADLFSKSAAFVFPRYEPQSYTATLML